MLIVKEPDRWEKLEALAGMATDDLLSPRSGRDRTYSFAETGKQATIKPANGAPRLHASGDGDFAQGVVSRLSGSMTSVRESMGRAPYSNPRKNPAPGIYRASMPDGKFINLFRVMFTDFCKMDCHYCPNSHWVPRKRFAFKVDELARTFDDLRSKQAVDGFFLSSGIFYSGSKTTERLVQTAEVIRKKYEFKGYIHLKVMPGAERHLVEAAQNLGTRLSVNIETATTGMLSAIAPMKDMQGDILDQMGWIDEMTGKVSGGAVGQATQMVVGAAGESDMDVYARIRQLYADWGLKRVYYVGFRPVRYTPLEDMPATSLVREHRLYQMDWLRRIYSFSDGEMAQAFDNRGLLSLDHDPKTVIALENTDSFPVDVNTATKQRLMRVPGIGPTSADRIVQQRRQHRFDAWRDLQAVGVVRKRAWPWLVFPGHRPQQARQLALDLFHYEGAGSLQVSTPSPVKPERTAGPSAVTSCAGSACAGCPLYGAPGHPGHAGAGRTAALTAEKT